MNALAKVPLVLPEHVRGVPVSRDKLRHVITHMRERDHKEIYALRFDDDPEKFLEHQIQRMGKMCRIWERDFVPVSVQGVMCERPGVWSMFAYGTDDWRRVVLPMTRWAWRFVIPAMCQVAQRVECLALRENVDSRRWIESFGARQECVLREYGKNREDFVLYAWKPDYVHQRRR